MFCDTLAIFKVKNLLAALRTQTPSDAALAAQCLGHQSFTDVRSFSHLRSAIAFLFHYESLKSKRVLLPRYLCPSIAKAIRSQGYEVMFVDIQKLRDGDLKKAGAVFVIHPFGIPIPMDSLAFLCRKNGVLLIEDCAHSSVPAQVGKWGDYVLFHFAKRQACLNGGLLISRYKALPLVEETESFPFGGLLRLFLQARVLRPLVNLLRARKSLHEDPEGCFDRPLFKQAHPLAKRFAHIAWKAHSSGVDRRVKLRTLYLSEGLQRGQNFVPLCADPSVDTLHFPVLVPFGFDRDALLLKLRRQGVFCDRLWYSCTDFVARRVLVLPLHEDMNDRDVRKMVNLCFQHSYGKQKN